ncbi:MAG: hypothetical protein NTW72_14925 [Gemmatimonadetes bacterium]|nr:hypothetical protein [Gemmatimonadota bacterium]
MPVIPFADLPGSSRVWLFGAAAPIDDVDEKRLLAAVDSFLLTWAAHGHPLWCARDWREERFLAVGVDTSREGASGCSVDGLFRTLKSLEAGIGTTLMDNALVYYRDAAGFVHGISRDDFAHLARTGNVDADTMVFDLSVLDAATYGEKFERRANDSWHAALLR